MRTITSAVIAGKISLAATPSYECGITVSTAEDRASGAVVDEAVALLGRESSLHGNTPEEAYDLEAGRPTTQRAMANNMTWMFLTLFSNGTLLFTWSANVAAALVLPMLLNGPDHRFETLHLK
jgi:hypothetical protein